MDEQMLFDAIERVKDLLRTVGPDDVLVAPFKAKATYGDLRVVIAAHSVIAGKVAELTEALKLVADENSWRGFSPQPQVERMRETARAALAPYPERRNE